VDSPFSNKSSTDPPFPLSLRERAGVRVVFSLSLRERAGVRVGVPPLPEGEGRGEGLST